MHKLRSLALIAAVGLIPVGNIYADGGSPCEPIPGQMNTPPCSMSQRVGDDDIAPTTTSGVTPANDTSDYVVTELTLDVVENLLALF
jgi:hypothetical protein